MKNSYAYLIGLLFFISGDLQATGFDVDLSVHGEKINPMAVQPQGSGTPDDPYRIGTLANLYWLAAPDDVVSLPNREYRWQAYYIQVNDINAADTETWFGGQGWIPVGTFGMDGIPFSGKYHGMSHVIENLYINRPDANNLGLFGYTEGAEIKHVGITDVFIEGSFFIGGLVGILNEDSDVRHCFVTGEVIAIQYAGGLIGQVWESFVGYSYSDISVTAGSIMGGLAGEVTHSEISQSFSLGSVISDYEDSPWKNADFGQSSQFRDRPESSHTAGGLAGSGYFAVITNSYSRAEVEAQMDAGGLVGNMNESQVVNSYSTGPVSGEWSVGGLVGSRWASEALNSFWDMETSGQSTSAGGAGKTTEEMQDIQTYLDAGWDFYGEPVNGEEDIWGINEAENDGYPFLMWQHYEEIPDIDLEEALAALEAAADAMEDHLAATGQETDAVYVAVEDAVEALNTAIDADPPVQEDIDDATGVLLDAVAALEDATQALITGILAAADNALDEAQAAQTAYTEYGGEPGHSLYTTVSYYKQMVENLLAEDPLDYQAIINATNNLNDATLALNNALENGQVAVAPAAGDGTPFSPYEIETLQNLYWIALNADEWNNFFLQIAHIDASPTQNWNDGQGWEPIGLGWVPKDSDGQQTKGTEFNGWYIGDGYEISGLYFNRDWHHHAGLFGAIGPDGVITDLALKNADITAFASLGALAGENQGMIFRCFSTGSVDGQGIVGGLVGININGHITDSYSMAAVSGLDAVGGLAGSNIGDGYISFSYAAGPVSSPDDNGGLIAEGDGTTHSSFWDTEVTGQVISAGGVGKSTEEMQDIQTYLDAGWDFYGESVNGEEDIWGINETDNNGYPFLMWQGYESITPIDLEDAFAALDAAADAMEDHLAATGQETDVVYVAVEDAVEALNTAIDADPPVQEDIDDATGVLLDAVAALEDATQALIDDIVAAAAAALDAAQDAMAAYLDFGGDTSQEIYTDVQDAVLELENLLTEDPLDYQAIINATNNLNDVTQALNDILENEQVAVAPVAGDGTPISPYEIETLQNLYWIALNADEWSSFFLQIAHIDASPTQNWNDGQGWEPIGLGLPPRDSDGQKTKGAEFNGHYSGDGYEISGLYYNRPWHHHAGLFGVIGPDGIITDLALKDVEITGFATLGALAGANQGMIFRCFSTGSVDGQDLVGGLVGINLNGHITDSYSMVSVSGLDAVGGLAGSNIGDGYISFSYAAGPVSSPDDNGGLIAEGDGITHSSFWDTEVTGQVTSAGGVGKSTEEMQDIQTYLDAGWDFYGESVNGEEDIWGINETDNNGYPFLMWQGYESITPIDLEDALAALDAAADAMAAYLAATGQETDAVYVAVEDAVEALNAAIDADPPVQEDIDNATGVLLDAVAALEDATQALIDDIVAAAAAALDAAQDAMAAYFAATGLETDAVYAAVEDALDALNDELDIDPPVYNDITAATGVLLDAVAALEDATQALIDDIVAAAAAAIDTAQDAMAAYLAATGLETDAVYAAVEDALDALNDELNIDPPVYNDITTATGVLLDAVAALEDATQVLIDDIVAAAAAALDAAQDAMAAYLDLGGDPNQEIYTDVQNAVQEIENLLAADTLDYNAIVDATQVLIEATQALNDTMTDLQIYTWEDLYNIRNNMNGIYMLMNDLGPADEGYDEFASASANDGSGWMPIGNPGEAFTGSFYGQQYAIEGLFIDKYDNDDAKSNNDIGLFGYTYGAYIRDVLIVDASILGNNHVGALVGNANETTIINCHVEGNITGIYYVGGLIGSMDNSLIRDSGSKITVIGEVSEIGGLVGRSHQSEIRSSHASGRVTGRTDTGGLVGVNFNSSLIIDCYSNCMVKALTAPMLPDYFGGLVARNWYNSEIRNSANYGAVIAPGAKYVGGIAGLNHGSTINNCLSANTIEAREYVGGIAGYNFGTESLIKNSFSRSNISGAMIIGGLVGRNMEAIVQNTYSIGAVTAIGEGTDMGGLIGLNADHTKVINSYWNMETSGQDESAGGEGRSTEEMTSPYDPDTYQGWDFEDVWAEDQEYDQNAGYPYLADLFPVYFPPENLVARARYSRVELWWDEVNQAIGYNVYRNGVIINEDVIEDHEFTDYNVINNTTYEYYIKAIYAESESLHSNIVEARPGKAVKPQKISYLFLIETIENLHWVAVNPDYDDLWSNYQFLQVADIDASVTQHWFDGKGWLPIGPSIETPFSTQYDAQGYVIDGLYINRCGEYNVGLFGYANNAYLMNINLTNVEVYGGSRVGSIVGCCNETWIYYSSANGIVAGCGENMKYQIGGLAGYATNSRIHDSYKLGFVSGNNRLGGLAGEINRTAIRRSYSLGNISASGSNLGGLVGSFHCAIIENSFAGGSVEGNNAVGGVAGRISCVPGGTDPSMVNNSYSKASVSGQSNIGGLAGIANHVQINNSYSISSVDGMQSVGGLVASTGDGVVEQASFWDIETSGILLSAVGTGLKSNEMKTMASFSDNSWSFINHWLIDGENNQGYPYLQVQYRNISNKTPTNLEAEILDHNVLLNWNKPAMLDNDDDKTSTGNEKDAVLMGYNVYRNQEVINEELLQITSFTDEAADPLVFLEYFVEAVYGDGETFVSNSPTVFICEGVPVAVQPVGAGTESNPYEIASLGNLFWLAANFNAWDKHYVQTAHISAWETRCWNDGEGFISIGFSEIYPFTGVYDGGNKTIEGLYISRPEDDYTGLFGYVSEAHISNMVVQDAAIHGRSCTGILAGHIEDSSIDNIQVSGEVQGRNYVGGLTGFTDASAINNTHFDGQVSGRDYVGGISGKIDNNSSVENSSSDGYIMKENNFAGGIAGESHQSTINASSSNAAIAGRNYAGGIIGQSSHHSEITNSSFAGSVEASDYVGGISGWNYLSTLENCQNDGQVTGGQDVGGIVGRSSSSSLTMSGNHNNGIVNGGSNVGGIVGYNAGALFANCQNTGNVTALTRVGGIAGQNHGSLVNCENHGAVIALQNRAGGLAASNQLLISDSNNQGTVISHGDYAGGLAAQNRSGAIIEQSFNTGMVQANAGYAGGVAGHNDEATLQDVYNMGSVSGNNFVGGLVGYHDSFSHINDSYSAGSVTGNGNNTGGLTGGAHLWGQTQNSYWDTETSGQAESARGEPRSTAEMTYPYADNTFVDWDFDETWQADPNHAVNQGYPFMMWYESDDDEEVPEHRHLTDEVITPDDDEVCYDALISITVSDFVVEAGAQVTFIAGESIAFYEGTHIEAGAYMHAYISDVFCLPDPLPKADETEIAMPLQPEPFDDTRQGDFFKVYPNPTEGWFTIEIEIAGESPEHVRVEIFNIYGTRIKNREMPAQSHINLDLGDQQPGMYVIRVAKGKKNGVERLIKR